jgi:hypothetical protein
LRASSNGDAHQDNCPNTYVRTILNGDWRKLDGIVENGFVFPFFRMGGGNDFHTRPDADILPNFQTACPVEKTLLSDPSALPYDNPIFVVPLQNCVMTDIDVVFQYDVFRMEDQHSRLNDHALAQLRELARLK